MRARRLRPLALAGAWAVAALVLRRAAPPGGLVDDVGRLAREPVRFLDAGGADGAVLVVTGVLAWLALGWLAAAALLVLGSALPGRFGAVARRASAVAVPVAARRVVAAALGVGLLAGLGVDAAAAAPPPPRPPSVVDLDLDWPVAAPDGRVAPGTGPTTRAGDGTSARSPGTTVVVRRGDTLWGLAATRLGAGATDEQVAREWPRWWARNRAVVGGDPDLLRPGQRLVPPMARPAAQKPAGDPTPRRP